MNPVVTAVALSASHTLTKAVAPSIQLLAGLGVAGASGTRTVWQDVRMS